MNEHDKQKQEQIKVQFEEIGRFIQAFEAMVNSVRFACVFLLAAPNQTLSNILLHHQHISAKTLIDIMRAMFSHVSSIPEMKFAPEEVSVLKGLLGWIGKEFETLANKRNELVHGTWTVGSDGASADKLQVQKIIVKAKSGLALADTPKNVAELIDLKQKCTEVNKLIVALTFAYISEPRQILSSFRKLKDDTWVTTKHVQVAT